MTRSEIEDGMGFAGLVPDKDEDDQRISASEREVFKALKDMQDMIVGQLKVAHYQFEALMSTLPGDQQKEIIDRHFELCRQKRIDPATGMKL